MPLIYEAIGDATFEISKSFQLKQTTVANESKQPLRKQNPSQIDFISIETDLLMLFCFVNYLFQDPDQILQRVDGYALVHNGFLKIRRQ